MSGPPPATLLVSPSQLERIGFLLGLFAVVGQNVQVEAEFGVVDELDRLAYSTAMSSSRSAVPIACEGITQRPRPIHSIASLSPSPTSPRTLAYATWTAQKFIEIGPDPSSRSEPRSNPSRVDPDHAGALVG